MEKTRKWIFVWSSGGISFAILDFSRETVLGYFLIFDFYERIRVSFKLLGVGIVLVVIGYFLWCCCGVELILAFNIVFWRSSLERKGSGESAILYLEILVSRSRL